MEKENKYGFSGKTIAFFAVILVIYAIVSVLSYRNMEHSLFLERSANTELLMKKISQNVETGIDTRWNSLRHLANQFCDTEYDTLEDVEHLLDKTKSYRNENILGLFMIDKAGVCYTSMGTTFKWTDNSLLNYGDEHVYISSSEMRISENDEMKMFFLKRLPVDISVDGITMTHLCLSTEMKFVDPFFDTTEFGDDSLAFIIENDGTQLYRRQNDNPLSGVHNVLSALSRAEYNYNASYAQLVRDINNDLGGCMSIVYNDIPYYLVYHAMETENWNSILLIPEANLGGASTAFMRSIIISIVLIAIGGFAVFILISYVGIRRNNIQRKLVNEQLLKAVEAEKSANSAKTKFLSSMSHDIRTPMNAIVGMTTLATKHIDDTSYVKSCLQKIALASNHLLTLINDVLDISKVESGNMTLSPNVFSLADMSSNLINIVRQQIVAKDQTLDIRVHNIKEEYVFADEVRLNQIFINLLSNAVKYTPDSGKITVDIKQEKVAGFSNYIRLIYIVEDNGIGMSEEFQRHMYNSFSREKDARVGTIQGTGLGLAICKQMVDLMNGRIECESELGKGTKFTVTLELEIADKLTENMFLPAMKVLLVDDDDIFLETAADTLSGMGITADCVTDGEKAVEAVISKHQTGNDYPVAIIDLTLKGMDGIETARRIRQEVGGDVPIIMISAYEFTDFEDKARAAGVNGFITKPFFPSTVYASMKEILCLDQEKQEEKQTEHSKLAGLKLLVAEDNDLNWEIACEILKIYKIETVRAKNGLECVDIINGARDNEYDMILMDIQMPIMNGYRATEEIRRSENEYVKNIPIVAMTADAFADDIQRSREAGMNAHIAKPINVNNLLNIIENRGGGTL